MALLVIVPILVACGGDTTEPTPTPEPTAEPSMIPHSLDGTDDSLMRHSGSGINPSPADHAG